MPSSGCGTGFGFNRQSLIQKPLVRPFIDPIVTSRVSRYNPPVLGRVICRLVVFVVAHRLYLGFTPVLGVRVMCQVL
jgi:hypothetical protein